jgi:16S rRNA (adenine1518-N6/adenine1519-N6)-dimethyltransferase
VPDQRIAGFRKLVVGLFGLRRKQLIRGLREFTGWPTERVAEVLRRTGVEKEARPEVLSPADFARLQQVLIDGGWPAH